MTSIPLSVNNMRIFENICNKLTNESKIRFCGVVSPLGRLVAGRFKDGLKPLYNEEQGRLLYTQSSLETSMKKEFDNTLGNVNLITTYRDNVILISIPLQNNYLVLISAEKNADVEQIVTNTTSLFETNLIL